MNTRELQTIREQAYQGCTQSQYNLGILLMYGLGLKKDYCLAKRLFEHAMINTTEGKIKEASATQIAVLYSCGFNEHTAACTIQPPPLNSDERKQFASAIAASNDDVKCKLFVSTFQRGFTPETI